MKFSQRHGYTEVRTVAQIEEIDDPLRTALWNVAHTVLFTDIGDQHSAGQDATTRAIWTSLLEYAIDEFPVDDGKRIVRSVFTSDEWFEVYDLVEFVASQRWDFAEVFSRWTNEMLEKYNAGYRILNGEVVPISSTTELEEIATAITSAGPGSGAAMHLSKAMGLLADRENPDYANSVKDSISAVESIAREMTGAMTLGAALNALAKSEVDLHPAQIDAWRAMYKVTNDTPGVRHGGEGEPDIDLALARYFLITSSAFVNLLLARKK